MSQVISIFAEILTVIAVLAGIATITILVWAITTERNDE